jgi:hypothetical protein
MSCRWRAEKQGVLRIGVVLFENGFKKASEKGRKAPPNIILFKRQSRQTKTPLQINRSRFSRPCVND